jgi:glyoxylase-like metal-dependent hydrolase (beta-lactamase superfamily II)
MYAAAVQEGHEVVEPEPVTIWAGAAILLSMVKKYALGKADVWSLNIASVERSFDQITEIFPSVPTDELKEAFRSASIGGRGDSMAWTFNAALIRLPGHCILVDTGFGFASADQGAGMLKLLTEAGVASDDVTAVVITHGHGDHIGGLAEEGHPTLPKARLVISDAEYRFFMEGEAARSMGEEAIQVQRAGFSAYSDRTDRIELDGQIAQADGGVVRAIPAAGHTPGHIGLEVESEDRRFWLLVDTLHASFQLEHPEWSPRYDRDPDRARSTRVELLSRAAEEKVPVLFYHLPFPGVGTIRVAGGGFAFSEYGEER